MRQLSVLCVLLGVGALLMLARIAAAGGADGECRTFARASPIVPFLITDDPPGDVRDWEPADPADPFYGIDCETLNCSESCEKATINDNGIETTECWCEGVPDDDCELSALSTPAGGFTTYQCMGDCEIGFCNDISLKVTNILFEFLPGPTLKISADIECECK